MLGCSTQQHMPPKVKAEKQRHTCDSVCPVELQENSCSIAYAKACQPTGLQEASLPVDVPVCCLDRETQ